MIYKIKNGIIHYDAKDLNEPKIFISNSKTYNTYILEKDTRTAFLDILNGLNLHEEYIEVFKENGFIE